MKAAGRWLAGPLLLVVAASCSWGAPGSAETDRQASVLGAAIAYPRQPDADAFARAALNTSLGRSGDFAVLEAADLHPRSYSDPAVRLLVRIHVPAHVSSGFSDRDRAAYDACYVLEFDEPSSALHSDPSRVRCPKDASPITPPSATPPPELPAATDAIMTKVLTDLPPSPTAGEVTAAMRAALPSSVRVEAEVRGTDVGVAASVGRGEHVSCRVASRTNGKIVAPSRPGRPWQLIETGCRAYLALQH